MSPQRKRSYAAIGLFLSASIAVALVESSTTRAELERVQRALRAEQDVTSALIREREVSVFVLGCEP